VDKTVLANEQVDANGCSWRSGAKVEQRRLKQWFLKISEFREDLLKDLEYLAKDGAWPERVLAMQKNWLGRSTGARIKFPIIAYNQSAHCDIEVFTTRPDTLFGVQYLALASTHPIVQELGKTDAKLQAFLDTMPQLPRDSKAGYLLPHVKAVNPISYDDSTPDATKTSLPIYIASYVLSDYGEGAVMGVPGHDARDHAFWKHNQPNVPVRTVISPSPDGSTIASKDQYFVHPGYLTASGIYSGQTTAKATKNLLKYLERKNLGSPAETWRLRDWLVSRQR
jgi:leucyl-tRNA synthetase